MCVSGVRSCVNVVRMCNGVGIKKNGRKRKAPMRTETGVLGGKGWNSCG